MPISLTEALRAERRVELGLGVAVTIRPLGFARFTRLNADALVAARKALIAEGEAEPSADAVAVRSMQYLNESVIAESLLGWDGVADADGEPLELTPQSWALFADVYPDLATVAIAEIRRPGLLAVTEGNA